jgi:hypothetical protein
METPLTLSATGVNPKADCSEATGSFLAGVPSLAKLLLNSSFKGVASLEKLLGNLLCISLTGVLH